MVLALKSEIREESFLEFICWLVAGAGCVRVERRLEAYTQHLVFWDRAEMMSGFPHPSRVPRLFILYLHFLIAIACFPYSFGKLTNDDWCIREPRDMVICGHAHYVYALI